MTLRSALLVTLVAVGAQLGVAARQDLAAPVTLTPARIETFLLEGRLVSGSARDSGNGTTKSLRVTLTDGVSRHDAHIQIVDVSKPMFTAGGRTELNFRDSYKFNVAAYRVARLLGIANVPVSVQRRYQGADAAFTWWVDDVRMDEKARVSGHTTAFDRVRTSQQLQVMRMFDELIANSDRNQGNMLWSSDGTLWLIDHTRAFRLTDELRQTQDLVRADRRLLQTLRSLTHDEVAQSVGRTLTTAEVKALMVRRDLLVAHYDTLIARRGEETVLFDLAR